MWTKLRIILWQYTRCQHHTAVRGKAGGNIGYWTQREYRVGLIPNHVSIILYVVPSFIIHEGNSDIKGDVSNAEVDSSSATHRVSPRLHPEDSTVGSTSRTTTTTTVSVTGGSSLYGASFADTTAPIIVLQEAPIIVHSNEAHHTEQTVLQEAVAASTSAAARPNRRLNPYNPRHQRMRRIQQSGEQIPNILLDPETLEQLVFHNAPVPPGMQEVEEAQLPVSKGWRIFFMNRWRT